MRLATGGAVRERKPLCQIAVREGRHRPAADPWADMELSNNPS